MLENTRIDLDSPSIYDEYPDDDDDDDNYAADDMELEEEDHGVEEQEDQVAEVRERLIQSYILANYCILGSCFCFVVSIFE